LKEQSMLVHVLFSSFGDDRLATTTQLSGLRLHRGATGLTNIAGRGSGGCALYFGHRYDSSHADQGASKVKFALSHKFLRLGQGSGAASPHLPFIPA